MPVGCVPECVFVCLFLCVYVCMSVHVQVCPCMWYSMFLYVQVCTLSGDGREESGVCGLHTSVQMISDVHRSQRRTWLAPPLPYPFEARSLPELHIFWLG